MIARLLAAWRKMRCEAEIIQIDREIDGIRAWRTVEQLREKELDALRAAYVRRLQSLGQDAVNRRTADNVRAMGK